MEAAAQGGPVHCEDAHGFSSFSKQSAGHTCKLLRLAPAQAGRYLDMPPASSRSAATAGHAKSASSKKSVHIKSARKSIATDPALLQGSSDEDGEGPPDHENESSSLRDRPTHRNGSANTSTKTSSRTHKSTASVVASAPKSSPRRSTRLSGEGLETQQASGAASTSKDTRNGQKHFKDIATSSKESPTSVPSKRKALSSSNARNTVDSAQPTPPETDSDTASGRTGSTSQKKATNGSQSSTFHPKKLKSASGEPSQSKPRVSTIIDRATRL